MIVLLLAALWIGAMLVALGRDVRIAVVSAGVAAVAALLLVPTDQPVTWLYLGDAFGLLSFTADGLGVMLAMLAAVIGCLTILFSTEYMPGQPSRYYALVLLFIGAMCGLVLTNSFLMLFFFWELTAFCSYALIAYDSDNPRAAAGGVRALVMTQVGGLGLLLGALVVYSTTGTYDMQVFINNPDLLPENVLTWTAFGLLLAAAAKSAQFPFHTWLPGAMEAPTPVSALIHAATMVNAGVYLLARFYPAFAGVVGWGTAVMLVGMVSALLAALLALSATDLKRVLAYSTVSQLGYMVYAVGLGDIVASQFHLMSHAIFKALLFLAAGAVIHSVGTRDMRHMGGLTMPFTRWVFIIGALALAGIPIFNGFWSKEMILEAGHAHWTYIPMLLGVGLTALYTVRMVVLVFFGRVTTRTHPAGPVMRLAMGVLAIAVVFSGVLIEPLTGALAATLPAHGLAGITVGSMIDHALQAGMTWVTLLLVGGSGGLWLLWHRRGAAFTRLQPFFEDDLGFSTINRRIVATVSGVGDGFARLHTGLVNWNLAAIVLAFALVVLWCVGGAR